eukprot:745095-Amphidinium_carterae.1
MDQGHPEKQTDNYTSIVRQYSKTIKRAFCISNFMWQQQAIRSDIACLLQETYDQLCSPVE